MKLTPEERFLLDEFAMSADIPLEFVERCLRELRPNQKVSAEILLELKASYSYIFAQQMLKTRKLFYDET